MLSQGEQELFWLALFLIAVAYFVGFSTDTQVVGQAFNSILLTAQGRNQQGQFAAYPAQAAA